jgi:hypothetical protein
VFRPDYGVFKLQISKFWGAGHLSVTLSCMAQKKSPGRGSFGKFDLIKRLVKENRNLALG